MTEVSTSRAIGITAAAAAGTFLAPLNSTMLAVALGPIREDFSVETASAAWLVTAYLIAMAVGQPIGGRLGDMFGRKRLYLCALVYFALASVACALAWDWTSLVFFRIQQAVAAAILTPNGMAGMRTALPEAVRGRAFGMLSALIGAGAALGPIIGGILTDTFGWRAIFTANVPVILTAALLAIVYLPKDEPMPSGGRVSFDLVGAVTLTLGLVGIFLAPSIQKNDETLLAAVLLLGGIASIVLFWWHELRAPTPLVAPAIFRIRSYLAGSAVIFFANFSMYTALVLVPLYLHDTQGINSTTSGVIVGLMAIVQVVFAPFGGVAADRAGRRLPALIGAFLFTGGLVMLPLVAQESALWQIAAALGTVGAGLGLLTPPSNTAALEAVPSELAGVAAGTYSTLRYLGAVIGTGLLGIVVGEFVDVGAYSLMVLILAVVGALTIPAAASLHVRPPARSVSSRGS